MSKRGNSNTITRKYIESLCIEMRQLNCTVPDTTFELFGEKFATPVMPSTFSHLNGYCENGMAEMARGVKEAGSLMWVGYGDDAELESVLATGVKTIKVVKPYSDKGLIYHKIDHAKKHGIFAIGMDIDHSFNKYGVPDGNGMMAGVSEQELAEYVKYAEVPFIVKGVLSVQDALTCQKAGVKGIVISHHHGIMDWAVPPMMVLPKIRAAVGNEMKIFVDCGIIDGSDVYKALALGADGVGMGRQILDELRKEKGDGICKALKKATSELAGYMSHTAVSNLSQMDSSVIVPCLQALSADEDD